MSIGHRSRTSFLSIASHCQFCLCGVHLMNHIPSTFRSGRNLSAVFYINWGKTRTPTALSVWYRVAEKFVSFVISFIVITNNVDSLVVSGPAKQQDLSIHQRGAEVKPTYPYISPWYSLYSLTMSHQNHSLQTLTFNLRSPVAHLKSQTHTPVAHVGGTKSEPWGL